MMGWFGGQASRPEFKKDRLFRDLKGADSTMAVKEIKIPGF